MAKLNLLTDTKVKNLKRGSKPGLYADGGYLYLRLTETGAKGWLFRYSRNGKVRQIWIGAYPAISLSDARDDYAVPMRKALAKGDDPASVLKPKHDHTAMTFGRYAAEYIANKAKEHRNAKAHAQWQSTIDTYCGQIADKRPAEITYADMLALISQPSLSSKRETCQRVLQRVKNILDDCAKHEGEPSRFNPALAVRLPKRKPDEQVKHHAALPFTEIPTVMDALRAKRATSAMLLRFIILTAARSGEARAAKWSEINLEEALWTLPPGRMKAGKEHVVPLTAEAVEILEIMGERRDSRAPDLVFPSERGKVLSDTAIAKQLRSVTKLEATPHGFRSSFRDFAAEKTSSPSWVAEAALAHVIKDKVEAAYRRGNLLEKRRKLMDTWADYLAHKDNVIQIASV